MLQIKNILLTEMEQLRKLNELNLNYLCECD